MKNLKGVELKMGKIKKSVLLFVFMLILPLFFFVGCDFIKYDVNVSATLEGGAINTNVSAASSGDEVIVLVTPFAGYEIIENTLKFNDSEIIGNSFIMPATNVVISCEFEKIEYSVSVEESIYGEIIINKTTATIGDLIIVSTTPNLSYDLLDNSLNYNGMIINQNYANLNDVYYFYMPAENVVISANFEQKLYNVLIDKSVINGSISVSKTSTCAFNIVTVTNITAIPGYQFKSGTLKVNGELIVGYSFIMPEGNAVITAEFEKASFAIIKYFDMENGTITVEKSAQINDVVTVTILPDLNYLFDELYIWTADGREISYQLNGLTATFIMPPSAVYIEAYFKAVVYYVNIANGYSDESNYNSSLGIYKSYVEVNWQSNRWTSQFEVSGNNTCSVDIYVHAGYEIVPNSIKYTLESSGVTSYPNYESNIMWSGEYAVYYRFIFNMPVQNVSIEYQIQEKMIMIENETFTFENANENNGYIYFENLTMKNEGFGEDYYSLFARPGDEVRVYIVPNEGYKRGADVVFRGYKSLANDAWYYLYDYNESLQYANLTMPAVNSIEVLHCYFYERSYQVTCENYWAWGSLQCKSYWQYFNSTSYYYQNEVIISVDPSRAYQIKDGSLKYSYNGFDYSMELVNQWWSSGSDYAYEYKFTMPAHDVTVTCEFEPMLFNINNPFTATNPADNGYITVDCQAAKYGDTVTIIGIANLGYKLISVNFSKTVTNLYQNDEIFTFTMPDYDIVVTNVYFGKKLYPITNDRPSESMNNNFGYIVIDQLQKLIDEIVYINAYAISEDYRLKEESLKYTYYDLESNFQTVDIIDGKFVMPPYAITLTCEFERVYSISNPYYQGSGGYGYLIVGERKAAGELVTIKAMLYQGYELTELTITGNNSIDYERNGNIITFTMPEENVTIGATFDYCDLQVTNSRPQSAQEDNNGYLSIEHEHYKFNEQVIIAVNPSEGYRLVEELLRVTYIDESFTEHTVTSFIIDANTYYFFMPLYPVTVTCEFER